MNRNMMPEISATQLVTLLVISRSVTLLTRPAAFCTEASARETVIGLCISVLLILVLDSKPVTDVFKRITSTIVTKILIAAFFIIAAVKALLSLIVFFQLESESSFPAFPIILLVILVVYYALTSGIEGIARFAFMIAVIFVAVLGFTTIANSSRMNIANLAFVSTNGISNIANIVLSNTLLCPEIAVFFVLRRYVGKKDRHKRMFRSFYWIQSSVIGLFTIAQELVFGSFTRFQNYPIYALAVVGEFSIFQRLDVIHLGVWVLVSIVKLCVLLIAASILLVEILPRLKPVTCNIAICIAAALGAFLMTSVFASNPEVIEGAMIGLFAAALISLLWAAVCKSRSALHESEGKQ